MPLGLVRARPSARASQVGKRAVAEDPETTGFIRQSLTAADADERANALRMAQTGLARELQMIKTLRFDPMGVALLPHTTLNT